MNYRFQLSISAVSSLVFVLLLNCSYASHQVAPGYELGWANYEIDTKVAKFPGKIPGKGGGRFYKINDFLNRASARERTGIYITEPYDPDKIPVLFVHGLICDPYAWEKMTKRLSRDPVIRENYQFWYYAYPSATPVIGSAAIFKLHLDTYIDALKEEHGHSLDRRVVIIGHSMGGILAKSVVSESGAALRDSAFTVPIDQLLLSEEKQDLVRKAFVYSPKPHIKKGIFIAAPHRGSVIAEETLGPIGLGLADPPDVIEDIIDELRGPKNEEKIQPAFREFLENPVNSIASLQPSAPISKQLADLPVDDAVEVHTLAGKKGKKRSDGIVPLASTVIGGVFSRVVLDSNHEVHKLPETSQIVNLILKHNIGLIDNKELRVQSKTIKRLQALDD